MALTHRKKHGDAEKGDAEAEKQKRDAEEKKREHRPGLRDLSILRGNCHINFTLVSTCSPHPSVR
jgi:hypothetical protein